MLERILNKWELEDRDAIALITAFVLTSLSFYITDYLNFSNTGIMSVSIATVMLSFPILKAFFDIESEFVKSARENPKFEKNEWSLFRKHEREVWSFMAIFMGVLLAYVNGVKVFGIDFFGEQVSTIGSITGQVTMPSSFMSIVQNNLMVFSITFLVSLIFLGGMVLMLVWNVSVFGVFLAKISESMYQVPQNLFLYLPHGLLELISYTIAGLAGGLLSKHFGDYVVSDEYNRENLGIVMEDVGILLTIGIGLIFLAGFVETI